MSLTVLFSVRVRCEQQLRDTSTGEVCKVCRCFAACAVYTA
jgi:hypothetical protein